MKLVLNIQKPIGILFSFSILMQYSGVFKIIPATFSYTLFILFCLLSNINKKINLYPLAKYFLITLFIFGSYLLFNLSYTPSPNYGTYKYLMTLLFIVVSITIMIDSHKINFHKTNVGSAILIILFIIISYGSPIDLAQKATAFYRLGGENNINPIIIARGLGFSIITLIFISFKKKVWLIVKFLLIVIACSYMILSGSKGPILALLISIIYVLIIKEKFTFKRYALWGTLLLIIGYNFINLTFETNGIISNRFINNTGSYTSRLDQYKLIIDGIKENSIGSFLIGNGLGSYSILASNTDIRNYPHNLILELIYETGFIGLITYLLIILVPLCQFSKLNKSGKYYYTLLLFYFINAQFTGDLMANSLTIVFAALTVYNANKISTI